MPSLLHVFLGAAAATLYCTLLGFPFARHLVGARVGWALAPALGWAMQSAAALPVFLLIGFSVGRAALVCAIMLGLSLLVLWRPAPKHEVAAHSVPVWAFATAAIIALAPAAVLIPKTTADGVALAMPIFDHAKVAIIDQIARGGLPAISPFFGAAGQPAPLAYYYLWHFSAAELSLLAGISGWEADAALAWFTAFAALMLMAGLAVWLSGRPSSGGWALLFAVSGSVRPLLVFAFGWQAVDRLVLPAWGLGGWFYQVAWAPQHVAAASSAVLAIFVIAQAVHRRGFLLLAMLALLAAAACESSAWIGGVLFPVAAAVAGTTILIRLPAAERTGFAVWAAVAALAALTVAAPFLHEQVFALGLRGGAAPVAFEPYEVLGLAFPQPIRRVLDLPAFWLVLLVIEVPAIYIMGVLASGALVRSPRLDADKKFSALILAGLAATGLVVCWLIASKVADNNDLGWRGALTAFVALIVLAAAAMSQYPLVPAKAGTQIPLDSRLRGNERRNWGRVYAGMGVVLVLLGLPATIGIASGDVRPWPTASARAFAETPALWAAVRRHSASGERIANNPLFLADMTGWPVNISWALMANRASCFAGRELTSPFVAMPQTRSMELEQQFERIFAGQPQADDLRDLATRYDCRLVVLTAQDGAWIADPFAASPLFQLVESNENWRLYRRMGGK
jgi:hypothetical protein